MISRPARWLTFGASRAQSLEADAAQNIFDLGLRPPRPPWLTLFGDWTVNDGTPFGDGHWGAGLEVRPLRGLHLGVRARERLDGGDPDVAVLVGVSGAHRAHGRAVGHGRRRRRGQDHLADRAANRRSPAATSARCSARTTTYVALDLQKRVLTYQKYRWLDDEHVAWLDLLRAARRGARRPAARHPGR